MRLLRDVTRQLIAFTLLAGWILGDMLADFWDRFQDRKTKRHPSQPPQAGTSEYANQKPQTGPRETQLSFDDTLEIFKENLRKYEDRSR